MPKESALTKEQKKIEKVEKRILKEEKAIEKEARSLRKEQKNIEKLEKKILFTIGRLKVTKKHVFDIAKITAGALLGTGFGLGFIDSRLGVAIALSTIKIIGIVLLSFIMALILTYKEEKEDIERHKHPLQYLIKRVAIIYAVAFIITTIVSLLFATEIPTTSLLIKTLLVGSFSAVAGAITFSII